MNKALRTIYIAAALVLFAAVGSAGGYPAPVFQDGGYHRVDYMCDGISVYDNFWSASTTVELAVGGMVGANFYAYDNSHIIFSGGWVYSFRAYDDSDVVVTDGDEKGNAAHYFNMYDRTTLSVSGGDITNLRPCGTSTVDVSGGSMWNLRAFDSSVVTVSAGVIDGDLEAQGNSNVTISGGSIGSYLFATSGSTVAISGGTIDGNLYADGDVTISGGAVGDNLSVRGSSTVELSGGTIGGTMSIYGTLIVKGEDFTIDGYDFPYGGPFDSAGESSRSGVLTCTLNGGEMIANTFTIYSGGSLVLIPEPATLSLLALGSLAMLRRRQ